MVQTTRRRDLLPTEMGDYGRSGQDQELGVGPDKLEMTIKHSREGVKQTFGCSSLDLAGNMKEAFKATCLVEDWPYLNS